MNYYIIYKQRNKGDFSPSVEFAPFLAPHYFLRKENFMYNRKDGKKRFSLWMSVKIYERLYMDSITYGVPMSSIVSQALVNYYRSIDSNNNMGEAVSSGKAAPLGAADTP